MSFVPPDVLRARLEQLLARHGEREALDRNWLRAHHPQLYLSALWFMQRFGLPLAFVVASDACSPILGTNRTF